MTTKFFICLLIVSSILSCSKRINVFKTGTIHSKNYCDTIPYDKNNKFIVLPVNVNGKAKKLIFDTGADIVVFPKDSTKSAIHGTLKDSNGNTTVCGITPIHSFEISNETLTDLYSFNLDFPTPFLCFCNGIIGNTILKSSNWLINENELIFSTNHFDIAGKKLLLDIFYYSSNRLHSNLIINGCRLDTCLVDYGGLFDIELSTKFYTKNKVSFKPNKTTQEITASYGANGKSLPDTVLRLNCNINFNGLQIDSVNIVFKKNGEHRLGINFLKRFKTIVINNSNQHLLISNSINAAKSPKESLFSFDLINGLFVVDSKIINESGASDLNIGDKFAEINSIKSSDFKNYCDFLTFKDSLIKYEFLDLKTIENKSFKVKIRRN